MTKNLVRRFKVYHSFCEAYVYCLRSRQGCGSSFYLPFFVFSFTMHSRQHLLNTNFFNFLSLQWSDGCYQTLLQNYQLKYRSGYRVTSNSCLVCHYLAAPFLTYTHLIKEKVSLWAADDYRDSTIADFYFKFYNSRRPFLKTCLLFYVYTT